MLLCRSPVRDGKLYELLVPRSVPPLRCEAGGTLVAPNAKTFINNVVNSLVIAPKLCCDSRTIARARARASDMGIKYEAPILPSSLLEVTRESMGLNVRLYCDIYFVKQDRKTEILRVGCICPPRVAVK